MVSCSRPSEGRTDAKRVDIITEGGPSISLSHIFLTRCFRRDRPNPLDTGHVPVSRARPFPWCGPSCRTGTTGPQNPKPPKLVPPRCKSIKVKRTPERSLPPSRRPTPDLDGGRGKRPKGPVQGGTKVDIYPSIFI